MIKKRLIFTLLFDSSNKVFCLSRNFRLQKVGDINWLLKNYQFEKVSRSIDELIILDVSRENRNIDEYLDILNIISSTCFIPITAGGWIRNVEDIKRCMDSGADKISINQPLYEHSESFLYEASNYLGAQSIVASIDYKRINGESKVYTNQGTKEVEERIDEIIMRIRHHVGEVLLTSIDKDGTGMGYDYDEINKLDKELCIPIVIAGGAGNGIHMEDALSKKYVNAIATANLFNFIGTGLQDARKHMIDSKINVPIFINKEDSNNA